MRYFYFLFECFLLCSLSSNAQSAMQADSSALYTVPQLVSDYNYLRNILEKAHPSLYRYVPKDSLDHYFDEGLSKLNHPMTEIQYWRILQHIVAKIGSGHTYLLLSEATLNKFNNQPHYTLPFNIYINNNKICIKSYNFKDTALNRGDEVVSIDGETERQLYNHIRTLVSGDGISKSYKNNLLEAGEFNRIYTLIHPARQEFKVVVKTGKGVEKTVLLKAASTNYNHSLYTGKQQKTPFNDVHYTGSAYNTVSDSASHQVYYPKDMPSLALLKINSFMYSDYLSFHKKLFKSLQEKNIHDLVIDIKNNPGGQDYICIDLLKYLITDNFYFTRNDEGVVNIKTFKALLDQTKGTVNLSLLDRKPYTIKYPANDLQEPYKQVFHGRIHLLINGGTFSAAALFATALKTQGSCIVYGYETGGGKAGCDGGSIMRITLPQTSLQLNLPLLWTYSASKDADNGRGLIPDKQFQPFWEDIDFFSLKLSILQPSGK